MTRRTAALLASLVLAACARAPQPQVDAAASPPDGASSTGGTGGSTTPDSAAGTGGAVAASPDAAPVVPDAAWPAGAPVTSDGPSPTSDGNAFPGIIPDGAPWQRQCPPGASRSDCCVLYCACMTAYCPATIPKDCQTACENGQNWDLVCRNYQCFASQNPNFPQDHDSHCRHAIGLQGRCGNR